MESTVLNNGGNGRLGEYNKFLGVRFRVGAKPIWSFSREWCTAWWLIAYRQAIPGESSLEVMLWVSSWGVSLGGSSGIKCGK